MAYVWFALFVIAVYFAIKYKLGLLTMTAFVAKKYTLPTDEEIQKCAKYA